MKRWLLIITLVLMGTCFSLSGSTQAVQAGGTTESFNFADAVVRTARNAGELYEGTLADYGVMRGRVLDGLEPFDTYSYDEANWTGSLGSWGADAHVEHWRMFSQNNVGVVIVVTAHEALTASLAKHVGGGWVDAAVLSIYKGAEGAVSLVNTVTLSDSTPLETYGGSFALEAGESLYYEFRFEWTPHRNMESPPVFTLSTDGENGEPSDPTPVLETFNFADAVVRTAMGAGALYDGNIARYGVMRGRVEKGLEPFDTFSYDENDWTASLGVWGADAHVEHWRMFSQNNEGVVIVVEAKQTLYIDIEKFQLGGWVDAAKLHIYIEQGETVEKVRDLTLSNADTTLEDFGGLFTLEAGERLYYEFVFEWTPHRNMEAPPRFKMANVPFDQIDDGDPGETGPADLTDETEIGLSQLIRELVLNDGESLVLKHMNLNAYHGRIPGTTSPFTYKQYNPIYDEYMLTNVENTFDGEHSAAFQNWRIKTTLNSHAIIAVEATEDIQLTLTHPATSEGWIDQAGIFIAAYVNAEGRYYPVFVESVTSNTNPADAFGTTVHLAAGDTFYWVFGSNIGYERNLAIRPMFTSSTEDYDPEQRDGQLEPGSEGVYMWDALTAIINNNYAPVSYNLLQVGFYYGHVFGTLNQFDFHLGDGTGTAEDALWDGITQNTGFQRWQIQTSPLGSAVMKVTAIEDMLLTVSHLPIWSDAWSTHTALRYIAEDVDGTKILLETRNIQTNTEADAYGLSIHLTAGQSLYIEYLTLNNEWGSVDFAPLFEADAAAFDDGDVLDFAAARALRTLVDGKIADLNALMDGLNASDYSLSRWSAIELLYETALSDLQLAQSEAVVLDVYDTAVTAINAINTIAQDAAELEAYRVQKKAELEQLVDALDRLDYHYSDWTTIQNALTNFATQADNANTRTAIDTFFTAARTTIENVPTTPRSDGGCFGNSATFPFWSLLAVGVTLMFVIKRRQT